MEDYREEAAGINRSILSELKKVHRRQDLQYALPKLEKLYNNLTDVMIAAHNFREKNPKSETLPMNNENHALSEAIRDEMNRIYKIEGGRDLLEKAQEQALFRLDAYLLKSASNRSLRSRN